jgi:hypothetical protein
MNKEPSPEQKIANLLNPTKSAPEAKAKPMPKPVEKVLPAEVEGEVEEVQLPTDETEELYDVGDEKLSWKELLAGRLRQKDYTSKTQKLSEERKAFEVESSALKEKLDDAKYILETELDDLNSQDMLELKDREPNKYWDKVQKLQNKVKKFEGLKQREMQKQEQEEQELIKSEIEKLGKNVPEWKDPENFKKDQTSIVEILTSVGYDQNSIDKIKDHRVLLLAKKAMAYDNLMNSKPDAKKVPVQGKSSNPTKSYEKTTDLSSSMDKLKKTGKTNDSIEAIRQLLSKK